MKKLRELYMVLPEGKWTDDSDAVSWEEDRGYACFWVDTPTGRILMPAADTGLGLVEAADLARFLVLVWEKLPTLLDVFEKAEAYIEAVDAESGQANALAELREATVTGACHGP